MMPARWHLDHGYCVFTANGETQAQQVRAFLEAAGISSELRGESLRKTHGLTLDGLGMVEIVVSGSDADRARALLASAEGGQFRLDDDADVGSP
jgi:Putative prokaryotic signal transducing protein